MKGGEGTLIEDDEEFDVVQFCRRHLRVSSWNNERSQTYTAKELRELLKAVSPIIQKESVLAQLAPPCIIVGDIHGQFRDLIRILNFKNTKEKKGDERVFGLATNRFMFLGDYVDRGPQSVECICLLFSLKIIYPDQYMLLRGNHETKEINHAYGFRDELINKLGDKYGVELWNSFNKVFNWLPLAGLVGTKILCMHGGISPFLSSMDDLRKITRPVVNPDKNCLECDLLWADPYSAEMFDDGLSSFIVNTSRGASVQFSEGAVRDCLKNLNVNLIVRAHQVQQNGFSFYADKKLITIFSAPRYNLTNNMGSVLRVSKNGAIAITTFSARDKKEKTEVGDSKSGSQTKKSKKEKMGTEE